MIVPLLHPQTCTWIRAACGVEAHVSLCTRCLVIKTWRWYLAGTEWNGTNGWMVRRPVSDLVIYSHNALTARSCPAGVDIVRVTAAVINFGTVAFLFLQVPSSSRSFCRPTTGAIDGHYILAGICRLSGLHFVALCSDLIPFTVCSVPVLSTGRFVH